MEVVSGRGEIMEISLERTSKNNKKYRIIKFKKEDKKNEFRELINLFCWESVSGLFNRIEKIVNSGFTGKTYFYYAELNESGFYNCKTIFDLSENKDLREFG